MWGLDIKALGLDSIIDGPYISSKIGKLHNFIEYI
jgi:hypothetical protein